MRTYSGKFFLLFGMTVVTALFLQHSLSVHGAEIAIQNEVNVSANTGGNVSSGSSVHTGTASASATVATEIGGVSSGSISIHAQASGGSQTVEQHIATSTGGSNAHIETNVSVEASSSSSPAVLSEQRGALRKHLPILPRAGSGSSTTSGAWFARASTTRGSIASTSSKNSIEAGTASAPWESIFRGMKQFFNRIFHDFF